MSGPLSHYRDKGFFIFACQYVESQSTNVWRNIEGHTYSMGMKSLPTGTILADKVRIFGEPEQYEPW